MKSTPESTNVEASGSPTISKLLAALPTVTATAAGVLWVNLAGWIAPEEQTWTFPAKLVLQVAGVLALIVLYLFLLYLRLWLRSRTRIAYGVMWDMQNNPICARCRGPLTKFSSSVLECPPCHTQYQITDRKGAFVLWWDAIAKMDEKYPRWFKRKKE